jgi:signal transduction histidine kinase
VNAGPLSERVLILTPTGRDSQVASELLAEAGFLTEYVPNIPAMVIELDRGAGVAVIADEALRTADIAPLARWLGQQPPWSDIPLLILTRQGAGSERNPAAARLAEALGNVAFVERPFHPTTFVSVVRTAMRSRQRQYEARALLNDLARERSALSDLTRTLEQRVQDRTSELLREAAQRAKIEEQLRQAQKMESLGQLTGGVAHDFNNLLMAVMGNLELLRKRVPDDPRLYRLIDSAVQGARRGATLTQRLLAFARQQDLRPVSIDLVSLIHDMTDLLERSLGPQIQLHLSHPEGLPPALVDPNQFELALLNLAINARDAMPEGGAIHIEVKTKHVAKESLLQPGDYLRVRVADTGSGMNAQTLARATEPFFSTKPVGRGTGLGLSMVHGLMVQLGGRVEIGSEPGKGTNVDLWIPVAVTAPEAVSESVDVPVLERASTVLLVDDDPLIATSAVDMLEDIGHTVIEVNSGQDALEILRSDQPIDILVTDHSMPGMTGMELARASREIRPDIPILLVTGFADLAEDKSLRLPRLGKPYRQDQLRTEIARLVTAARGALAS